MNSPLKTQSRFDAREKAVSILIRVDESDAWADVLLDNCFRKEPWPPQDRALTTELVYGVLRWRARLQHAIRTLYHGRWGNIPQGVRIALEAGLYQIFYLDRIPAYAAVNETVKWVTRHHGSRWGGRVNAMMRAAVRRGLPELQTIKCPVQRLALKESHPEWLVRRWSDQYGIQRAESICRANNQRPPLFIRINSRIWKDSAVDLIVRMGIEGTVSGYLQEFIRADSGPWFHTDEFKQGIFSFQDVSAGLVAHLMDVRPGDSVWDMTAAPGGKAAHMAELCPDALIAASDRSRSRFEKIVENQNRLRLTNLVPILADGRQAPFKSVDKVLIDAPCSGSGVLRRRGELRWRKRPEHLLELAAIQHELLNAADQALRKGGILIYSTCSVLPEENGNVIDDFLKSHPSYIQEDAARFVDPSLVNSGRIETWPDLHDCDGSFAVRMRKIS